MSEDVDIEPAFETLPCSSKNVQAEGASQKVRRLTGRCFNDSEDIKETEVQVLRQGDSLRRNHDGQDDHGEEDILSFES